MESSTLPKPPVRPRRDAPADPIDPRHGDGLPAEHGGGHDEIPDAESLPRPSRAALVWIAVILVLVLAGAFFGGLLPKMHRTAELNADAQAQADALPTVSVQLPKLSPRTVKLDLPGNAEPLQETSIYARTTGYLKKWMFDYGAHVKSGSLLADIDAPDVDEQLQQARGTLASDQANVAKAQLDLTYNDVTARRYEALIKTNGVTPQELDMYHANFAKARTALQVAQANVAADQANVKRLEDLQSFERITAPFAGTITARNFDVGALITANGTSGVQPLFRIAETDVLRVWVSVPQVYSTEIHPGMRAQLSVREYPGRLFEGKVAHTAGALDPGTRTLLTEVQVPNSDGTLLAGMYCDVKLDVTDPSPPLIVPVSALIADSAGNQVAVIGDDNVAHYHKVDLGRDFGNEIEVLSGLNKDDRIVTNPGERLAEGSKVRILTPQNSAS